MFLEFLNHALSLDLAWIIVFILNNIIWVFLLMAWVVIAGNGKKVFWSFILLVGSLWIVLDLTAIWNLTFVSMGTTVLFAIFIEFFAKGTSIEKHQTAIQWLFWFAASFFVTFILIG